MQQLLGLCGSKKKKATLSLSKNVAIVIYKYAAKHFPNKNKFIQMQRHMYYI